MAVRNRDNFVVALQLAGRYYERLDFNIYKFSMGKSVRKITIYLCVTIKIKHHYP